MVQAALYLQPSVPVAALGALVLWPLQTRSIYVAHNHHHHRVVPAARAESRVRNPVVPAAPECRATASLAARNFGHHAHYRNQDPADPDADPHCWIGRDGRRLTRWAYTCASAGQGDSLREAPGAALPQACGGAS
ncbi:MAG: hypothetical protein MZW92_48740 [Comamonadaceae bacterium]|nr:hypothetical protein [Comamonadaceae bacterium]